MEALWDPLRRELQGFLVYPYSADARSKRCKRGAGSEIRNISFLNNWK